MGPKRPEFLVQLYFRLNLSNPRAKRALHSGLYLILEPFPEHPHLEGLVPYPSQQNGSNGFKYRCLSKV